MAKKKTDYRSMSDHDLLIRVAERQDCMYDSQKMHLSHHWAFFIGAAMLLVGVFIKAGG